MAAVPKKGLTEAPPCHFLCVYFSFCSALRQINNAPPPPFYHIIVHSSKCGGGGRQDIQDSRPDAFHLSAKYVWQQKEPSRVESLSTKNNSRKSCAAADTHNNNNNNNSEHNNNNENNNNNEHNNNNGSQW